MLSQVLTLVLTLTEIGGNKMKYFWLQCSLKSLQSITFDSCAVCGWPQSHKRVNLTAFYEDFVQQNLWKKNAHGWKFKASQNATHFGCNRRCSSLSATALVWPTSIWAFHVLVRIVNRRLREKYCWKYHKNERLAKRINNETVKCFSQDPVLIW